MEPPSRLSGSWRLLIDDAADGPHNMGVDEALFATAQQSGFATVRLYRWKGPWLSLGYTQKRSEAETARLREAGVGWVRRVTGGRAVLHGEDLTYAIAAPIERLPPSLRASYSLVADALLVALQELGVPAERSAEDAQAPGPGVFDCFAEPAADELCLGGRKFSGSAQRRAKGALLQHGSIRLGPAPASAARAVGWGTGRVGGTSLVEEGFSLVPTALIEALSRALATALGADLVPAALSDAERAVASRRGAEPGTR